MRAPRLWEVEVKATVYVVAEDEREAEQIACRSTERGWLNGYAALTPVDADQIDWDWRHVPPLHAFGDDPAPEETCREIAEREALAREVAARQAVLPGVKP